MTMDRYTTIFGGREALSVPGETAMTVGPIESHSIFGTDVTAADADIPSIAAPQRGPVDMTPMPIVGSGPSGIGPDDAIPITDKVLYGMSTFGGPVRDVAGLGAFGAELMLEQTKHGDELVQAAAGLGGYRRAPRDLGFFLFEPANTRNWGGTFIGPRNIPLSYIGKGYAYYAFNLEKDLTAVARDMINAAAVSTKVYDDAFNTKDLGPARAYVDAIRSDAIFFVSLQELAGQDDLARKNPQINNNLTGLPLNLATLANIIEGQARQGLNDRIAQDRGVADAQARGRAAGAKLRKAFEDAAKKQRKGSLVARPMHGDLGRYAPYRGDLGAGLISPALMQEVLKADAEQQAGADSGSSNTMMYVAIGVGVLALAGAAYYYTKS